MHAQSYFNILAECRDGYIGVCTCCNRFNFVFNNLLVTFSEEDLFNFLDWLLVNRNNRNHLVTLHHGKNKVYTSPHSNLFLAFNDEELDEIAVMAGEAQVLIDVQKILQKKSIRPEQES